MTPSRDFIGDKKPKEGTINPRSLSDDKQTFGVSGIGYWYAEDKLKEAIKELKEGCGRRFLLKRPLRESTFKKDHRKDYVICGNNLSSALCPECKKRNSRIDEIFGKGLLK